MKAIVNCICGKEKVEINSNSDIIYCSILGKTYTTSELLDFNSVIVEKRITDVTENVIPKSNKLYFAHPYRIWGHTRERRIIEILKKRGYDVVNPFDGEENVCKAFGVKGYYDKPTRKFAKVLKNRDFKMVDACDTILAYVKRDSACIGTVRELDRAIRAKKHTIVIGYKPNPFLEEVDELYLSYKDFIEEKPYDWSGEWRS